MPWLTMAIFPGDRAAWRPALVGDAGAASVYGGGRCRWCDQVLPLANLLLLSLANVNSPGMR
jgi:hypothetical protein